MSPTDEQVDLAIAAFDENWRKRPDITVKNFSDARRDAMRAALQEVLSQKERPQQHRGLRSTVTGNDPIPKSDREMSVRSHG